jgi:hypothetical protein
MMSMSPAAQRPLRFRKDLRVTPTTRAGKREFLIEDRVSGRFHLLGEAEYYYHKPFVFPNSFWRTRRVG